MEIFLYSLDKKNCSVTKGFVLNSYLKKSLVLFIIEKGFVIFTFIWKRFCFLYVFEKTLFTIYMYIRKIICFLHIKIWKNLFSTHICSYWRGYSTWFNQILVPSKTTEKCNTAEVYLLYGNPTVYACCTRTSTSVVCCIL